MSLDLTKLEAARRATDDGLAPHCDGTPTCQCPHEELKAERAIVDSLLSRLRAAEEVVEAAKEVAKWSMDARTMPKLTKAIKAHAALQRHEEACK